MDRNNNNSPMVSTFSDGQLSEIFSTSFKGNKRPWNRVNLPVYSISSKAGDNQNMHIITYASQISMQPKQFVCGIYNGTKTLENIQQHNRFVLQILAKSQYRLVNLLGKKSICRQF